MSKLSPEKWDGHKKQYLPWWESLSIDEKNKYKSHFLKVREWNENRKPGFPNMWNIKDIRISQLTEKHIYRIWVFKDYKIEL